jgi:acyl transferase domain-containing protein/short-subunit dehydrogenase/acyl carrier protein
LQGLGLEYCRQLVRQGCRFLVVTSRGGKLSETVSKEFALTGCRVVTLAADAANSKDMSRVMTYVREELPYIQHYAHAAGVSGFNMLQDMEVETFWEVANAKVVGAPASVLANLPLETQVLFSSTSAVWSQTGAAHYAAANAFLDGFAVDRHHAGLPATSLQLGPFAEAGMAAGHVAELEAIGLKGLHPNQMQDAVLVAGNAANVVYARINTPKFVQLYTARGRWSLLDSALQNARSSTITSTVNSTTASTMAMVSTASVKPRTSTMTLDSVAKIIRSVARDILGEGSLKEGELFDEFPAGGFDSLSAVELSSSVGTSLNIQLPGTLVYDYPSVSSMAAYVLTLVAPSEEHFSALTTLPAQSLVSSTSLNSAEFLEVKTASRVAQPNHSSSTSDSTLSSDSITAVPYGRWDLESLRQGKTTLRVRFGGFLTGVDLFDASLFSITGTEADLMDPQHRLVLETSWEALQNHTADLASDTGVYIGIQQMEYNGLSAPHLQSLGPFSATAGSFSVAAGRLSFIYGLKGPAVSMDTACSSAMVATHTAAGYLRSGVTTATTALAGGVNLLLSESTTGVTQAAGMLTSDGRCKALDARADGYVRAEACIMLVLSKPGGSENIADALLRATAVNQDGRSSSLTAPNGPAQQNVIRNALLTAHLSADSIETLQMHGTGTALGDPIEVGAALAVLPGAGGALWLAAAKSRVGHAEPVAGLVGFIHAIAMMKDHTVHAISHLYRINPMVAPLLEGLGKDIQYHAVAARQDGASALRGVAAGVSAFAFQGTNAHALISRSSNISAIHEDFTVPLWQHRRHWFAPAPHTLLRKAYIPSINVSRKKVATLQVDVYQSTTAYLLDHVVSGRALLPAAAMVEACHAVAGMLLAQRQQSASLINVSIASPLVLSASSTAKMLEVTSDAETGRLTMASIGARGGTTTTHLSCTVGNHRAVSFILNLERHEGLTSNIMAALSMQPPTLTVRSVSPPSATATLASNGLSVPQPQYHMHPATLDCATQTGSAMQVGAASITRVPVGVAVYCGPSRSAGDAINPTFTAIATIQGRDESTDSVVCGYKVDDLNSISAEMSALQFKPIGGAGIAVTGRISTGAASTNEDISPLPGLYAVDWQATDPVLASNKSAKWTPSSGKVTWQLGTTVRVAVPMPPYAAPSVSGLQSSLQIMQVAAAASGRPEVILHTPLLEPGLPDTSPAYAAAAGLLKVAAQEHSSQRFKHAVHDGYNAVGHLPPTDTDIFGIVSGEGVVIKPRMMPIPLPSGASSESLVTPSYMRRTWLVTGGVGDVGRLVGLWALNTLGVTNVILLGRSGRSPEDMWLNKNKATENIASVTIAACNIAMEGDVSIIKQQQSSLDLIGFVFHAGAVLKDGVLARQNASSLRSVYTPKVTGAAHLSATTQHQPVTHAIYCSSLSAQLGTPGQSNYAAANAALDAQAQHAANSGLAVGAVLWGPWASGMGLRDPKLFQGFKKAGLGAVTGESGLGLLRAVLGLLGSSSAAALVGASIKWSRLLQGRSEVPGIFSEFKDPREIRQSAYIGKATKPERRAISVSVDARSPPTLAPLSAPAAFGTQNEEHVLQLATEAVNRLLDKTVSPDQPLMEAGLDSLGKRIIKKQPFFHCIFGKQLLT